MTEFIEISVMKFSLLILMVPLTFSSKTRLFIKAVNDCGALLSFFIDRLIE